MTPIPLTTLAVILAVLVVLSAAVALLVLPSRGSKGTTRIAANNLEVISGQPVSGTGTVTVEVNESSSDSVSLKIQDAAGTTSSTKTVTDGSSEDQSDTSGVIVTTLDLSELFSSTPASGTGAIYAGSGDSVSISGGTYDAKRQLTIDSDAPTAVLEDDTTVTQGTQARIPYTITDDPQKVSSSGIKIIDADGNVQLHFTGLGSGENREVQFVVSSLDPASYDVKLIAEDEAGHRTTDTRTDGLVVEAGDPIASKVEELEVLGQQPVDADGTLIVEAGVSTAGETASFKVQDADGTVCSTKTIVDGGQKDQATRRGVVRTPIDLSTVFDSTPVAGTAVVFAGGGDSFSIPEQTYDNKTQFTIDAAAPMATITHGAMVEPGQQAKVGYTVTDDLQEVKTIEMKILDQDGNLVRTVDDLQMGVSNTAQFELSSNIAIGAYDVKLIAEDEVGHKSTDTLQDGLLVMNEIPTASNLSIVGGDPVKGTGTATVEVDVSVVGADVTFKFEDEAGTLSSAKTVTEGSSADQAGTDGVVRTTLDLGALFDSAPVSGSALLYAGGGPRFSVSEQTFDTKRQFIIDADRPTATVITGASASPGQQVKIEYAATDVPQKAKSITMEFIDPDGNVEMTLTNLQVGEDRAAQFVVPRDMPPAKYDVKITVVDEVGYQATHTLTDGLVVTS